MIGPMVCGHGLFQFARMEEPAAMVPVNCGSVVVPGSLQARLASMASVMGLRSG